MLNQLIFSMSETESQTSDVNCVDQCNSTQTPSSPGQILGYDSTGTAETPSTSSGPGQVLGYGDTKATSDLSAHAEQESPKPKLTEPSVKSFSSLFLDLLAAPFAYVAKSFNYVGNTLYYYLSRPFDYVSKPFNFLAKHFGYLAKSIASFGR